jgi:hypothetical protein
MLHRIAYLVNAEGIVQDAEKLLHFPVRSRNPTREEMHNTLQVLLLESLF